MRNRGQIVLNSFPARWRVDLAGLWMKRWMGPGPLREAWRSPTGPARLPLPAGSRLSSSSVRNESSLPVPPDGPGVYVLIAITRDRMQGDSEVLRLERPCRAPSFPGRDISVVRAAVPNRPGQFQVEIHCVKTVDAPTDIPPDAVVELVVTDAEAPVGGSCGPLLQAAGQAVAAADRRQALPDEYTDVTEGRLAGVKRLIKQKLLGNFKHAYVDVLSRQQTAFNRAILEAVQEALECCTLLDHAVSVSASRGLQKLTDEWTRTIERAVSSGRTHEISDIIKELVQELARSQTRQSKLEKRIEAPENSLRRLDSSLQPQGTVE